MHMTHLIGLSQIAKAFKTSARPVVQWYEDGAPIFRVGQSYQCIYEHLLEWMESKYSKCLDFQKSAESEKPVK